jgi:8-oxo-dGTP pyrophosphatase MutT (NUDIX family)
VSYVASGIWRLRQVIGHDLVVAPAAVVVVLDSSDKVLLIRRTDTGDWSVPGGAAEPSSTFASTAVDELFEETGLRADASDLVANRSTGDPRSDGEESSDVGFFALDAVPQPATPHRQVMTCL